VFLPHPTPTIASDAGFLLPKVQADRAAGYNRTVSIVAILQ
jgi:hypothetical protein